MNGLGAPQFEILTADQFHVLGCSGYRYTKFFEVSPEIEDISIVWVNFGMGRVGP